MSEEKALAKLELPLLISEAQRDFLLQRTPAKEVKQRKGRGGRTFDYIEIGYVIEQLNKVFGFDWDFEVVHRDYIEMAGEVVVEGKLTVRADGHSVIKTQFGGAEVKHFASGPQKGKPLSIADDFKAAASDALKKCASLLGVGLDVYRGNGGKAEPGDRGPRAEKEKGAEKPARKGKAKWYNCTSIINRARDEIPYYEDNAPHIIATLGKLEKEGVITWDTTSVDDVFDALNKYASQRANEKAAKE